MVSKSLLVLLAVYLLSDFSRGQIDNTFFRNDYHYIESSNSFYKFHTGGQSWREAKLICAQEGASLFYPESDEETQAVLLFWNSTRPTYSKVYVGISALMAGGVFETIDGKLVNEVYNNWKHGEPQNGNQCVCLLNDGFIIENSCEYNEAFICKKSMLSLQWNYNCNMSNLDYIFSKDIGKCYKLHTTPLKWKDAYVACRREQTTLAVIRDQKELDFLAKLAEAAPKKRIGTDYQRGIFHLGFHNQRNEGWQTVKGTPFNDVSGWWGNFPADQDDSGKQCGSMFYTGRLNNVNCDTKSFFFCEHEVDSSTLSAVESGQIDNTFFRNDYHYIESSNSFYKFHTRGQSWHDAKKTCAQEGASLFYPENDEETQAVISFWNSTQPTYSKVHVGISALLAGVFGTIDGKLVTDVYNNWKHDGPQNGNQCVCLLNDGYLNENSCKYNEAFICKKSMLSLQWNYNCNISNLDYIFSKDISKCYKLHTTPLKWNDAYVACHREQTTLAVISDQKELDFLAKLAEAAPKKRIGTDYQRGIFHLGFHNQRNEGWQTVKGTPLYDASGWWGNFPADEDDSGKQCGSMFYTGRLNNVNCDTKSFFFCEHEVDSSTLSAVENNYLQ